MKTFNTYINEWKLTNDSKNKVHNKKVVLNFDELSIIVFERYAENPLYIDLRDIDVSNIKSFAEEQPISPYYTGLFAAFRKVEVIDITGWNISNAESLACMFWSCQRLETIYGIEKLDVSNVKNFNGMFQDCHKLKCDLNNWKVHRANISDIFDGCDSLTLPNWFKH